MRFEFEFDAATNRFRNRGGGDAVLGVVRELFDAATRDFINRALHVGRDNFCIEQRERISVACRATHRLNEC